MRRGLDAWATCAVFSLSLAALSAGATSRPDNTESETVTISRPATTNASTEATTFYTTAVNPTTYNHSYETGTVTTNTQSTTSFFTSSTPEHGSGIVDNPGNTVSRMKMLPEDACEKEGGASALQQGIPYEIFELKFAHDDWDENTTLEVTCQLRTKYKNCADWVTDTVQHVSLEVNGTRQDYEFREYFPEENVVKFFDMLHYESHHKARFSCVHRLQSGAELASSSKTFYRVDELHDYTITPEKSRVPAGGSFALTCKTDSTRALSKLGWKVITNEDFKVAMSRDEKRIVGLSYDIHDSVKNLHSVLTVTTEKEGQFGMKMDNFTFHCTEEFTFHANQKHGKASVIIHTEDNKKKSSAGAVQVSISLIVLFLSAHF